MKDNDMAFPEALSIVGTWIGATVVLIVLVRALQKREQGTMNTAYGSSDEHFYDAAHRLMNQLGIPLTEEQAETALKLERELGVKLYSRPFRPATIAPRERLQRALLFFVVPETQEEKFVPNETARFIRHLVRTGKLNEQLQSGESE